jgi:enoyl-[acyl-carrier protein] reductase II
MIKNNFYKQLELAYSNNADAEELKAILGRGRAKKGMFEGDLDAGELEVGQVSGTIHKIMPAKEIVVEIIREFKEAQNNQSKTKFIF